MKNKKIITTLFLMLVFILGLGMVSAISISVDNYYPTPVEAGEYLNVWLKVTNRENVDVENAVVKLKQSFPFSLDPGEPEETVISSVKAGGFVIEKFKIRVDGSAAEGENRLTFQYADSIGGEWKEKSTPVTVIESQTFFDVVLQELNEEGVFIAIANIGKNPANAVTIRIPEQEHFRTQTVSASIVGNLASGDYTLVGFQILPKSDMQRDIPSGASAEERQQMRQQMLSEGQTLALTEEHDLLIQVDYTDPLGSRRTIFKGVTINPQSLMSVGSTSSTSEMSFGGMRGANASTSTSFLSDKWFWLSAGLIALMIGVNIYKRVKKRKD